jgi:hypothetical protein
MEDDRDRTLRALEGLSEEQNEGVRIAQKDQQSTEDLFLNLAQDDANRRASNADSSNRADRRKVRAIREIYIGASTPS